MAIAVVLEADLVRRPAELDPPDECPAGIAELNLALRLGQAPFADLAEQPHLGSAPGPDLRGPCFDRAEKGGYVFAGRPASQAFDHRLDGRGVTEPCTEGVVNEVGQPERPDEPGTVDERSGDAGARDAVDDQSIPRIEVDAMDDRQPSATAALARRDDVGLPWSGAESMNSRGGQMRHDGARRSDETDGQRALLPCDRNRSHSVQAWGDEYPSTDRKPTLDLAGRQPGRERIRPSDQPAMTGRVAIDRLIGSESHGPEFADGV